MSNLQKKDFLSRHNLSSSSRDLDVIECAEFDIKWLKEFGISGLEHGIAWLEFPLRELGEHVLFQKLEKEWARSNEIQ